MFKMHETYIQLYLSGVFFFHLKVLAKLQWPIFSCGLVKGGSGFWILAIELQLASVTEGAEEGAFGSPGILAVAIISLKPRLNELSS